MGNCFIIRAMNRNKSTHLAYGSAHQFIGAVYLMVMLDASAMLMRDDLISA